MIQRPEYGEGHPDEFCCYCGNRADTVDHVPSKVLLDLPYPDNLPVVPCCKTCNKGFSLDEEYVAVLLECVRWQTFVPELFHREKIKKIVEHSPSILEMAKTSILLLRDGRFLIDTNNERFNRVLTKLIAGHLRFEGLEQWCSIVGLEINFYHDIRKNQDFYRWFHTPIISNLLPEVGSRALCSLIECGEASSPWFLVQPYEYEYCVAPDNSEVRIIIQDFFGVRGLVSKY